jgi:hypothetical protein
MVQNMLNDDRKISHISNVWSSQIGRIVVYVTPLQCAGLPATDRRIDLL